MTYTAITDRKEVEKAFKELRNTFRKNGEEGRDYYGNPRYYTRDRNELWGAFGSDNENRYYDIAFGRGRNAAIFHVNPPKEGDRSNQGSGLFVQDNVGNKFLTHFGDVRVSRRHGERSKRPRSKLMEFARDFWVEVTRENGESDQRFLVAKLDFDNPTVMFDQIDRTTAVIESFKRGEPPLSTDTRRPPTEDSSTKEESSALNAILYGPPGTGKTYKTFRRCVEMCDGSCPNEADKIRSRYKQLVKEGRVEFVTFHQSYGYEEFVEGLRPDTGSAKDDGEAGAGFRLVPTDGVLKRIAERARGVSSPTGDTEASAGAKPHVLVIDEINRANISKVMGELITLLEEDKREGAKNAIAVTLPHSRKPFTLPANLYILGTMNTADRSIALLDTALRRRFEFEELPPKPELLEKVDGIDLPAALRAINKRLEYLIDRDHLIGHAWLMDARTKEDVDRIMRHKIIPLIAEYFYDDWRKVQAVLGNTDDFVQGKQLKRPPGLEDTDGDEDHRSWTIREDFADGAYERLISGGAQDPGQTQDQ